MLKVAINGFGRIGRMFLRAAFTRGLLGKVFDVVAVNTRSDVNVNAHLFKYDSTYGRFNGDVYVKDNALYVSGYKIQWINESDPLKLPWSDLGVDVVVESTGRFRVRDGAEKHITAGANLVIISAPGKGVDATIVPGVNDEVFDKSMKVISLASCTTNCLAPLLKVLHSRFGVENGFMTTVHAYTNDQMLLDKSHKDYRRARAAGINIIPTTTGAASAIGDVIPDLKGKLDGIAIRVPIPVGSLVDLVVNISEPTDNESVNKEFQRASNEELKGILAYTDEPIVSSDIVGNPHSSIIDASLTRASGKLVKVCAWYDNEYGYSNRLVDFVSMLSR